MEGLEEAKRGKRGERRKVLLEGGLVRGVVRREGGRYFRPLDDPQLSQ